MKSLIPETVRENPWIQTLLLLGILCVAVGFLYWVRNIIFPFFLAFIIAYILDPVVDGLEEKLLVRRSIAVVVLLFGMSMVFLIFLYYLTDQSIEFVSALAELASNPPDVRAWLNSVAPESVQAYVRQHVDNVDMQLILQRVLEYLRNHVAETINTLSQGSTYIWFFASQGIGAVGVLLNIGVIVIVAIYFLRDFDNMVSHIRSYVPHPYRPKVDGIFSEIDELMRAFLRGHLTVCVIIGVLYGVGYELVGLDGGFLVGFLSGLMNVVPYIGPTIGFVAAFLMALYQFGISYWLLAIIGVYVFVQSLEGNILTPKIVGRAVGLNPVIVIFSMMLFGKLLGFLGLLLAIPLTCIVKVILSRLSEKYRSSEFFQPQPAESD